MAITRSNIAHRLLPIALLFAASVPYGVCFSMNRFATEDGIPFLPYVFLYTVTKRLSKTSELHYFYYFEIYYHFYVLLLPFIVFFGGKIIWKGRTY